MFKTTIGLSSIAIENCLANCEQNPWIYDTDARCSATSRLELTFQHCLLSDIKAKVENLEGIALPCFISRKRGMLETLRPPDISGGVLKPRWKPSIQPRTSDRHSQKNAFRAQHHAKAKVKKYYGWIKLVMVCIYAFYASSGAVRLSADGWDDGFGRQERHDLILSSCPLSISLVESRMLNAGV